MIDWEEKPDVNITPLVDVMLVLLAILMVTMPTLTYEENIVLPIGTKQSVKSNSAEIQIRADVDRKIFVNNHEYSFESFPDNFILLKNSFASDTPVYIKADKRLVYADVMRLFKSVKEAGFSKVALETGG